MARADSHAYVTGFYGTTGPFTIAALFRSREDGFVIASFNGTDMESEACCWLDRLTKVVDVPITSAADMDSLYG